MRLPNLRVFGKIIGGVLALVGAVAAVPALAEKFSVTPTSVTLPATAARSAVPQSAAVRQVAGWVVATHDNKLASFIVVDKVAARLFLFAADGTLQTSIPVLVGLTRGDDSPAGIGNRPLASITPAERITPAGRFVTEPGKNMAGQDILWVDYDAAIALHRASDRKPGSTAQSRAERLASPTAANRRISLGCINVATEFYDSYIRPGFGRSGGIVYILPETRSAAVQFHIPPAVLAATDADASSAS